MKLLLTSENQLSNCSGIKTYNFRLKRMHLKCSG